MTSVAVLTDQAFAQFPGGTATYVRRLVPALSETDPSLDITLFHTRLPDARPEPWMRRYWMEELSAGMRSLYPQWAIRRGPALPADLAGKDLLHAPSAVAVPPSGPGQRLVVTVHDLAFLVHPGSFPRRWALTYRAGLARAVRSADALIAVSRHTAEDLLRRTHVRPAKVYVAPLAPSLPEGNADVAEVLARHRVSSPYILSVGTLEPRKNLVRLVRAYRRVAARGAAHSLVLVGPVGWRPGELLEETTKDGPGHVALTGQVSENDLDAFYRGASAFVYPSLYEGFGLPVLDAMARGIPTIVSTSSSLPEVAGEAGLPIDPRSVGSIAEALELVVTDPALAARLSEAGRKRAARFSWERTAGLTLEVYKTIL
jgi:glycosyltransferase involved in cell wall biosynthesis